MHALRVYQPLIGSEERLEPNDELTFRERLPVLPLSEDVPPFLEQNKDTQSVGQAYAIYESSIFNVFLVPIGRTYR